MSDNKDLYDHIAWLKQGGYQGAALFFYDLEMGEVYLPFEKKRNVEYSRLELADVQVFLTSLPVSVNIWSPYLYGIVVRNIKTK